MIKHLVAPSLLAADFYRLHDEVALVNESQADWLHIDVMDGVFVPNISFGFPILKALEGKCSKPLDVHLMISEPTKYVQRFRDVGAEVITVHVEACPHLHSTVQLIRSTGAKAGVALNPHTPISMVEHVLEEVDLVLMMSVNPGFGGQKFIYETLVKLEAMRDRITTRNLSCYLEVDGGVGLQNAERILQAGADVLVAGSSVFKSPDPKNAISQLKSIGIDTIMV